MVKQNISIIGSGSFGCALANHLSINNNVKIWSFKEEEADAINNNHECIFIKNSKLNENIKCYLNYKDAISNCEYIFLVIPSSVIEKTIISMKEYLNINQKIVICSKGINENLLFLSQIVKKNIENEVMILSGPSHAEEVIKELPTKLIIGSKDNLLFEEFSNFFNTNNIKVEYSNDLIGIQFCNSIKNVIALANGMLSGAGYKDNSSSLLITKSLQEIEKIVIELGGQKETVYGITGLGDLIVTCYSENSRNRRAGILLSQGYSLDDTLKNIGMVVEGIDNLSLIIKLLKQKNIESNLLNIINNIVFNDEYIDKLVQEILNY